MDGTVDLFGLSAFLTKSDEFKENSRVIYFFFVLGSNWTSSFNILMVEKFLYPLHPSLVCRQCTFFHTYRQYIRCSGISEKEFGITF